MVWSDFINGYLDFTDGVPSPPKFRLWAAISCVAGALERRVWAQTSRSKLFPNLFVALVGTPGVGKGQALVPMHELWMAAKKFKVAPDNVTKASLVDAIAESGNKRMLPNGAGLFEYHSLLVSAPELGVLLPAHDLEFLSVLNHLYDNPRYYRENRRSLAKQIDIAYPQLNIVAGTQPGFMATLLPEEAWTMGFTSRIIMVHSAEAVDVPLFGDESHRSEATLVDQLRHMSTLMGEITWTPEAKLDIEAWVKGGCLPVPTHSKLANYNPRRKIHAIKLAIVAAVSRTGQAHLELEDVHRARTWLLAAEESMPDVFREMVGKSDSQVIQELHFYLWKDFAKDKKPAPKSKLIYFLQTRVPADKCQRVLEIAEMSNIVVRIAGTESYIPRPLHEHGGVE